MRKRDFGVVVVGGGPAGELCTGRLGEAGLDVALVERELVGVLHRRDELVHGLDDLAQEPWLAERNVMLVRGHDRLDGPRRARVDGEALVARRAVVVAAGSGPLVPPIPGLAEARPWTSREATTARAVPESLLVLGGGVVGAERAQAWASLGSRVTLVELFDRLLIREEPFAGEQVAESLRERGVDVRTRAKAVAAERGGGGVCAGRPGAPGTCPCGSGARARSRRRSRTASRCPRPGDARRPRSARRARARPSRHRDRRSRAGARSRREALSADTGSPFSSRSVGDARFWQQLTDLMESVELSSMTDHRAYMLPSGYLLALHFDDVDLEQAENLNWVALGVPGVFCDDDQQRVEREFGPGFTHFHDLEADTHGGEPGAEGVWFVHVGVRDFESPMSEGPVTGGEVDSGFMPTPAPTCA